MPYERLSNLFLHDEYSVKWGRFYFIFSYIKGIFDSYTISVLVVDVCADH